VLTILSCVLAVVLRGYLKANILPLAMKFVKANIDLFLNILYFVFFACSAVLCLIIGLLAKDDKRVQGVYHQYFSKLVSPDYYKKTNPVHYENIFGRNFDEATRAALKSGEGPEHDARLAQQKNLRDKMSEKDIPVPLHFTGVFRCNHPNGKIKLEAEYLDGVLNGFYRTFYEDGTRHQEKRFKGGKLDGVFHAFDELGLPYFDISYKNGVQHGEENIYYRTGIVQYKDTYVEGKRVNRKTYDSSGNLRFDHWEKSS